VNDNSGRGVSELPNLPRVVITLAFESKPRVVSICDHEGDQLRLADWLEAHPELGEIVKRACALQREERAA
jgi:hypothetical protein